MTDTYSVTDLRQKTALVLADAKENGYVAVVKNSKKDAYIVSAEYFLAMQEAYDDYLDNIEFEKGMESLKKEPAIPLEKLLKKLESA